MKQMALENEFDFPVFHASKSALEWSLDVFYVGSLAVEFSKTKEARAAANKFYEVIFSAQGM